MAKRRLVQGGLQHQMRTWSLVEDGEDPLMKRRAFFPVPYDRDRAECGLGYLGGSSAAPLGV